MTSREYSRAVLVEMTRLFRENGQNVPRSLDAPFVDLKVYHDMGLTPRQAAKCYLGLAGRSKLRIKK